ncbi:hypothetical protein RKE29_08715 [Streptomyces sp. B1866]|uniref:hypothetical protein n=1 Tax=Streptomyces sp. B1866 TaxID=3075431 RepID=UPI00288E8875|nr:hypothetical protein [Streptomyces sp. B1866]MDT3396720.1 hypothetical protein [Streptomyces sp. B1866]
MSTLAAAQAFPAVQLAKDLDDNKVTPGVLGFIVFALMGVAVWLLMKSMNKHMKKVDFQEAPEAGQPRDGGPAAARRPGGAPGPVGGGARPDGEAPGRP